METYKDYPPVWYISSTGFGGWVYWNKTTNEWSSNFSEMSLFPSHKTALTECKRLFGDQSGYWINSKKDDKWWMHREQLGENRIDD